MNNTRKSLSTSIVALVLCFSMLVGTTFAWFTDSVTSSGNIIASGNLKVEMEWSDDYNTWNEVDGPIFNNDKWEPGYT